MNGKYILQGHVAIEVGDLFEWARWYETADRQVALTRISDDVVVSTVFRGLGHSFGDGPPLLFETLVFTDGEGGEMRRYATWEEAEAGHAAVVKETS